MTSSNAGSYVRAEISFSLSVTSVLLLSFYCLSFAFSSLPHLAAFLHPFLFLSRSVTPCLFSLSLWFLIFQGSFLKQLPHAYSDLSYKSTEAKDTHTHTCTHRVAKFVICLMHVMRAQALKTLSLLLNTHTHT